MRVSITIRRMLYVPLFVFTKYSGYMSQFRIPKRAKFENVLLNRPNTSILERIKFEDALLKILLLLFSLKERERERERFKTFALTQNVAAKSESMKKSPKYSRAKIDGVSSAHVSTNSFGIWRRERKEEGLALREDGFVVISVCITNRTVLSRGKIPRNNARHACKYGRAPQMGHSNVSRYCFHQRWPGPSTDHVVNPTQYLSGIRKAFVSPL